MSHYGSVAAQNAKQEYCCEEQEDVLDTSRFVMGNDNGSESDSEESYEDYDWTDPANCVTPPAAPECTTPPAIKPKAKVKAKPKPKANSKIQPHFNFNDPLRYFLETDQISQDEYDKWKIVKPSSPISRTHRALDFDYFVPDSNMDDEVASASASASASTDEIVYGYGYETQFPCRRVQPSDGFVYDPWFPNPDPTPNKEYTEFATSMRYMMSRFVIFESDENNDTDSNASILTLNHGIQLKLIWERFAERKGHCTLQEFWQTNALVIYEALQELNEMQAKCLNIKTNILNQDAHAPALTDTPGEFHTTPLEILENTYETIGRMSRCIAEDFNQESVVNYVEEFIRALYVELQFMEIVLATIQMQVNEKRMFERV